MKNKYFYLFLIGFLSGLGTGYFLLMRHYKLEILKYSMEVKRVENLLDHSQMMLDAYNQRSTELYKIPCELDSLKNEIKRLK